MARIDLMPSHLPNSKIKVITEEDLETITKKPITDEDKITERNVEFQQNLEIKEKFPQFEIGTTISITIPNVHSRYTKCTSICHPC